MGRAVAGADGNKRKAARSLGVAVRACIACWRAELRFWCGGGHAFEDVDRSSRHRSVACGLRELERASPPVVLGMTETTPPAYGRRAANLRDVPAGAAAASAADRRGASEGRGGPVSAVRRSISQATRAVAARFTLSNLDAVRGAVHRSVNEFVRYSPGIVVSDEAATPNFSGINRFFILPAARPHRGHHHARRHRRARDQSRHRDEAREDAAGPNNDFAGPALFNRAFDTQTARARATRSSRRSSRRRPRSRPPHVGAGKELAEDHPGRQGQQRRPRDPRPAATRAAWAARARPWSRRPRHRALTADPLAAPGALDTWPPMDEFPRWRADRVGEVPDWRSQL